jgi:hypothetical protein
MPIKSHFLFGVKINEVTSAGLFTQQPHRRFGRMKVKSSIERGADYLCTKLGDVVTAIEQVAVVKGLAMWEVERKISAGIKKRLIVSERQLVSLQLSPA